MQVGYVKVDLHRKIEMVISVNYQHEFIIILKDLRNDVYTEKIAVDVCETLSTTFIYKENQLFIGGSIGISIFPEYGIDEDTLIKK